MFHRLRAGHGAQLTGSPLLLRIPRKQEPSRISRGASLSEVKVSTKAYILIETAVGKSRDVSAALQTLPGVTTVDPVTGPYDIIAVVEAQDLNAVGDLVTSQIHTIGGIGRTVTCLSVGAS